MKKIFSVKWKFLIQRYDSAARGEVTALSQLTDLTPAY